MILFIFFLLKCFLAILFGFFLNNKNMAIYSALTGLIFLFLWLKKLPNWQNARNHLNSILAITLCTLAVLYGYFQERRIVATPIYNVFTGLMVIYYWRNKLFHYQKVHNRQNSVILAIICSLAILYGYFQERNNAVMPMYNAFAGLTVLFYWLKKLQKLQIDRNFPIPAIDVDKLKEGKKEFIYSESSFLNTLISDIWQQIVHFANHTIKHDFEKFVHKIVPGLSCLRINHVDLGKKAPKITGLALEWTKDRKRLSIDVNIEFNGDISIRASLTKKLVKFGVNGVMFKGRIRVYLEPILDKPPFIGAATIYFPEKPDLRLKFTGLTRLANPTMINTFVHKKILEAMGMLLIKPKALCIPLDLNYKTEELNYTRTMNIFRIYVLEAEGFRSEDFRTETLSSYVAISSAKQKARTSVANNSLNPTWHQAFEMAFNDIPEQEIEFRLFNDRLIKGELLGSCRISVKELKKHTNLDMWLPLDNVAPARLHIRSQRLRLVTDRAELRKVLVGNHMSRPIQMKEFSSALLSVHVSKGKDLKLPTGNRMPTTLTEIHVGKMREQTLYSPLCIQTPDPVWKETFSFLMKDPRMEKVELVVKDNYHGSLGSISVPISRLLEARNLTITDWYELCPSEHRGAILVKLELWILVPPNGETQKAKVPSSQQPQCKDVNKRRAGPRLLVKRKLISTHYKPRR
ncbi:hypothetical protein XENTR_v10004400 [Xenopus tropicalis]|nr:hypothetical protein XENTR_v10004400 [Xenopus tropicalis]